MTLPDNPIPPLGAQVEIAHVQPGLEPRAPRGIRRAVLIEIATAALIVGAIVLFRSFL